MMVSFITESAGYNTVSMFTVKAQMISALEDNIDTF